MDFITDLSTETVFELIKGKYRELAGEDLQIGSEGFAIASMVAYVCGVMITRFNEQAKQRFLATATGEYLDALGETFNLPRPVPTHATISVMLATAGTPSIPLNHGVFVIGFGGARFTPLVDITAANATMGGPFEFVGISDNVADELGIIAGTEFEILTPVTGVTGATAVSDATGGSAVGYPYTDAGDDAYRQYIIDMRSATSAGGPAAAYEMRAKKANADVLDAYCLRYDDPGWEAGVARVFVRTAGASGATLELVRQVLLDPDWKPVCDRISVNAAIPVERTIPVVVGLTVTDAIEGPVKVEGDIASYTRELRQKMGADFSISELAKRCQTPDTVGVRSVYIYCLNPADNFILVNRWEYGDFTVMVDHYETVGD